MKHFTLIAAAVLAAVAVAASGQQPTSTVRGTVVRVGASTPISGVEITLTSAQSGGGILMVPLGPLSGTPPAIALLSVTPLEREGPDGVLLTPPIPFRTTTGPDGRFEIPNVPDGAYILNARRDGYFGHENPWNMLQPVESIPLPVLPKTPIELQMVPSSTISGRITDARSNPLSGARVAPYQMVYRDGRRTLAQRGAIQTTNANGEYRLANVAPPENVIGVYAPRPASAPVGRDLRIYYPGTADPQGAAPITVPAGVEIGGIDIVIPDIQTLSIKGRAVNSLPAQSPRLFRNGDVDSSVATFALAPRNTLMTGDLISEFPNVITTEDARRNGEFEIRGVLPGLYDLFPMVRVLLNGQFRIGMGRIPIEVRQQDIAGLAVPIHPGVDVRGSIRLVGAPDALKDPLNDALNKEATRIGLRPLDNTPEIIAAFTTQPTDLPGSFVIENVGEGPFGINVLRLPESGYIVDILQGNTSVFDSGIIIGKTPPAPIDIIVNTQGQIVEGVMSNASGKPTQAGVVVLAPPVNRRGNTALFRVGISDHEGRFKMTGVAPGNYKVFSWEKVPLTAWQDAAFMSKYESQGREVRVGKDPMRLQTVAIPTAR